MQLDIKPLVDAIVERLQDQLMDDEILDLKGAASLLKLSVGTVTVLARTGEIPGRKLGSTWRFRKSSLLDAISESTRYQKAISGL